MKNDWWELLLAAGFGVVVFLLLGAWVAGVLVDATQKDCDALNKTRLGDKVYVCYPTTPTKEQPRE